MHELWRAAAARIIAGCLGAAAGVWWALPIADVAQVCPAAGEGRAQCVLNEVYLTLGLHVLLGALLGVLASRSLLAAPAAWRAWRRKELFPAPVAMSLDDDRLIAATWSRHYSADGRTHVLGRPRLRWVTVSRRNAGAALPAPVEGGGERQGRFTRPQRPAPPLPLDDRGRLRSDDLRGWLATWPATDR